MGERQRLQLSDPGRLRLGCQYAELVALRVGEYHPTLLALPDVDVARAQADQPVDLGLLVVGGEVDVEAVLDGLAVGHREEQPDGALSRRWRQHDVPVGVGVLGPPEAPVTTSAPTPPGRGASMQSSENLNATARAPF
ncbi:hypothetical protein MSMEG_5115 [Mycolicibacterium smegmatis MC2 155]|uniref:Uncharacterized protein n=1 Tax=Mycolicibacterium smegmatis (strain ATCC 700084 / mc(2)155) TaxID=246196 RepID=A0R2H3_MYCS2|nr:hypothetical protein MSMEG_5115 [Mycolicibacterium smegmatis MC2 155]